LGNGDGTFKPTTARPATGVEPSSIAVGDFNGDGIPDLAVANYGGDTVTILLGNGDGTFTAAAASPATGSAPISIAVGDFNGDGRMDLAVANHGRNSATVLIASTQSASVSVANVAAHPATGTQQVVASYAGDSNYKPSTSSAVTLKATIGTPTASVTASSNPGFYGSTLTLTAVVKGSGLTPTGTVIFYDGGKYLGVGTLSGGTAADSPAQLALGSHSITVKYLGDSNYNATTSGVYSLTIDQGMPDITWATPAAITYGTALSATQLDASTTVAGTFAYSPVAGTVLSGGSQKLTATFTPTDTVDYTTATAVVTLTVNKATPPITWATPAAITYGTALSATQLDATSTVAGTFAYTPALGTVLKAGSPTLSVTFTPADSADYASATSTVMLTVNKATPAITWATPAAITYGTALSAAQLDATSKVAGSLAYTPAIGTVLKAGSHTLSVTLTPTDTGDYKTTTATVQLTVNKVTSGINWATPAAITYGTALSTTQLDATSKVTGTLVYTPAAGTVLKAGTQTLSVTLTPTDSTDYTSATSTVTLTVSKAVLIVTASSPTVTYGSAVPVITPSYSGFRNGDTVSVVTTAPACTTTYTTTTKVNATKPATSCTGGVVSSNYKLAYVSGAVTVTQATPSINWATPAAITYGTALSGTQLDATSKVAGPLVYTPTLGTVLKAGSQTLSVALTPTDSVDYKAVTRTVELTVTKAVLTVTANNLSKAYGSALPPLTDRITGFVNGDTAAKAVTGTASLSTTATVKSAVATYPITAATGTLAAANYSFKFVAGTLTVTKAVLTVTANNLSKVYGAALPTLTDTITGFVNGDTAAKAVTGAAELSTRATAKSAVGTYPITAAAGTLAAADYSFKFVAGTLTVTKAVLTVTANSLSKVYGAALPTLTDTITGFVNGDTAAKAVTGAAKLSTTATATSAVGTYPITAATGTLAAANYSFKFVAGTLTITPIGTAATPTFTPPQGTYTSTQEVTIRDTTSGAAIYYTTNGDVPTAGSTKYSGAIAVAKTETLKAIAIAAGYTNSTVAAAVYTIK
jgi:hypothetical protein